ncbi:CFF_collapsed_G0003770.mRNA.1.CDS.1 [Saccharomyces cerevisiae]|nr:CFF_collapsed_G0003770.mRNA.1.CDS.1 [Saccharomyces cerevisiae]
MYRCVNYALSARFITRKGPRIKSVTSPYQPAGQNRQKEANDFVGSNISNEPVYDTVIQTGQSSNATNSFVQETIQKTKQKESGQPYIIPQKNEHQRNIDKICETSDLKAKLAPIMEVLEKKTNEKIKGIIRKRVLQEPDRDNDDSG